MNSIEIKMPPGKGMTCGVLLAGALRVKNSPNTLFIILKSFAVTMKIVVFTIF